MLLIVISDVVFIYKFDVIYKGKCLFGKNLVGWVRK